ncbi:MAG: hypothetical protein EOO16_26060 [Chitinophagaceae bacterium]|nr:MAG: hypothetical protein EOO16_26060 [Chitinophagaceae bacterium]
MANYSTMTTTWDQQRKRQALIITGATGAALLLLFILLKWPIPTVPPPVAEQTIEIDLGDVNLGNSDVGSGKDQPQVPGAPAPGPTSSVSTPASSSPSSSTSTSDARTVETDDNSPSDAPAIRNPTTPNPKGTTINSDNNSVKPSNNPPAPPAPMPKAVFGGIRTPNGTGPGGNGADSYKPGTGEGPGNGTGDAGSPGGNPKGTIRRNDREVVREYYFQSDLPPATVKAELLIDRSGKASLRRIVNGSMGKYKNAIQQYLPVMNFNKSDHESVIVYTFNFRTSGG